MDLKPRHTVFMLKTNENKKVPDYQWMLAVNMKNMTNLQIIIVSVVIVLFWPLPALSVNKQQCKSARTESRNVYKN